MSPRAWWLRSSVAIWMGLSPMAFCRHRVGDDLHGLGERPPAESEGRGSRRPAGAMDGRGRGRPGGGGGYGRDDRGGRGWDDRGRGRDDRRHGGGAYEFLDGRGGPGGPRDARRGGGGGGGWGGDRGGGFPPWGGGG